MTPILTRTLSAEWMRQSNYAPEHIRRVERGDYDNGTYVTRFIPQAEAEILREREEVCDAE